MLAHPAASCGFFFLQIVLAPLLYPYGYLIQIAVSLVMACSKRSMDRQLTDPIILALLLTDIIMADDVPVSGYASRITGTVLLYYLSTPLQLLSVHLVDPLVAIFLVLESIAAPHLYPMGFVAQLVLYHFLVWTRAPSAKPAKCLDDDIPPSKPYTEETYTCKICFDKRVDQVFTNCGHCCCQQCSEELARKMSRLSCPFCNTAITQKVSLFFP